MSQIVHVCPKCGRNLYVEDESRLYDNSYGCTVRCGACGLSLLGVDLTVCEQCEKPMKNTCKTRYFTIIKPYIKN